MSLVLKPCADQLVELDSTTCVQRDESRRAEVVGSAPSCGAAFFVANISHSNNTHISILGHCLQVQTNNSERTGICYQPELSWHSPKHITEATFLVRVRMDSCYKYIKNMLLADRDFTFPKRKVSIWHFL